MTDLHALATDAVPYTLGVSLIAGRLFALLYVLPGFRRGGLPFRTRGLIMIIMALGADLALGGVKVAPPNSVVLFAAMMIREVLIGAGMGLIIRLFFATFEAAGIMVSTSMGLALNVFVDPTTGDETMAMATIFSLTAALVFIAVGGDHLVLQTWFTHMTHFPVGELSATIPDATVLATAAGHMFTQALILASPVVAITLVINIGLGFITRVVPSVNIFGVGLGMLIVGGYLTLGMSGGAIVHHVTDGLGVLPHQMVDVTPLPSP
jgi:flagellar biosynthetic protein FliR